MSGLVIDKRELCGVLCHVCHGSRVFRLLLLFRFLRCFAFAIYFLFLRLKFSSFGSVDFFIVVVCLYVVLGVYFEKTLNSETLHTAFTFSIMFGM